MSLRQYFDIIEKRLFLSREENCYREDSSRSRGRCVMEEKLKTGNDQAKGRMKDFLSENSEENLELSEVRTGCSNQDEARRNFQNVVDLLQLCEEQVE